MRKLNENENFVLFIVLNMFLKCNNKNVVSIIIKYFLISPLEVIYLLIKMLLFNIIKGFKGFVYII